MGCDSRYMQGSESEALRVHLDTLTRLLCAACKLADAGHVATKNEGVALWWEEHQKADRARIREEQRQRNQRRKALLAQSEQLRREAESLEVEDV